MNNNMKMGVSKLKENFSETESRSRVKTVAATSEAFDKIVGIRC